MDCTPVILAHETPFSIGAVEVSPSTRELRNNGKSAILEPRVMQVLVALYRANGSVVSKDDLVTCCWEGRIVGDDAINRVIGRLRHEASDHADDAFRVETITRVGYRLVEGSSGKARSAVDRRWVIGGTAAAAVAATVAGLKFGLPGARQSPRNEDAQRLLEEGVVAFRQATPDQITNAVAKLRAASELDPANAEIWGTLSLAYRYQRDGVPPEQQQFIDQRADDAQRRALAIDPRNGMALASGVVAIPLLGNWLTAEAKARAALKLQPNHPALNKVLGYILGQVGRTKESLPLLARAAQAEPMVVGLYVLRMFSLWSAGRLDEAEQVIDRAVSLWPKHFGVWFSHVYLLAYTGRGREALSLVQDAGSRPIGIPDWNFEFTALEVQAAATRQKADIDKAMAKCFEVARRGAGFAENSTMFAGAVGRIDDGFRMTDAYYFDRGFAIAGQRWSSEQGIYAGRRDRFTYFLFGPTLGAFRKDPRFDALTREIGLQDYWRKSGSRPDYLS